MRIFAKATADPHAATTFQSRKRLQEGDGIRRSRLALLACVVAVAAIPVTLAFAQTTSAPTVTSTAATTITAGGATLGGTVNPNSSTTEYGFQYGPTASYGEETTLTSAGSGNTAGTVSGVLTGLQSGTTYHFRMIAINAGGTAVGSDETFATTGTAPAPSTAPSTSTGTATAIGQAGATLSGTFNPNGQATSYYFEYGPTSNYGYETNPQQAAASSSQGTATDTLSGLNQSTTYHFRLVAISPGGVTLGSDAAFTTTTPPTVTSTAPTGVNYDSGLMTGTVNPQGITTTYYFQYGSTTAYGLQTPPVSAGSGTSSVAVSATATGLLASSSYHYRLVATSSGGASDGADETITTTAAISTVRLIGRMGFVSPGQVIGVEVGCFGPGACSGSFKVTFNGKTIGTGSFKEGSETGGFQNIKLNSTGQSDMRANRVNHLLLTNVAITTTAGQTVDGRLSLADWSWRDLQL